MTGTHNKNFVFITFCLLAACSRGPTPGDLANPRPNVRPTTSELVGTWVIERTPRIATPFLLDLVVDSVVGSTAFGRITRYFVGDVGGNPGDWRGFAAEVTDSTITIAVRHRGLGDVVFYLAGNRRRDVIELSEFRISGANLVTDSARWALVRSEGQ